MTAALNSKTLVLNSEWQPINILPVWKAVMKVFNCRALFLDTNPESLRLYDFESWVMEWEEAIRSSKIAADQVLPLSGSFLFIPDVIVCTEYRGFGYKINGDRKPKFSRKNLLLRDKSKCQFCGKKFKSEELTMDHVVPKSKGGIVSWENIVCACVECNHRKRDRTPAQAHMKLIRKPFQPTVADLRLNPADRIKMQIIRRPPKTWEQFLGKFISDMYWNVGILPD